MSVEERHLEAKELAIKAYETAQQFYGKRNEFVQTLVPHIATLLAETESKVSEFTSGLVKLLYGFNPFEGGRDGDQCLWCHRDYPRGSTNTWQETWSEEHHDTDCEFARLAPEILKRGDALERPATERG